MEQVYEGPGYSQLIPLRTAERKPPLFCVHDGNFRQMAAVLRGDQAVYGLRWVDFDTARSPLSIDQLAASHLKRIRGIQRHGPYQLIGYSFGGLVAYEMARLLVNTGEAVGLLALVDTLHPRFYQNLSPTELRRFRRRYLADRLRKYSRDLIHCRFDRIGVNASKYFTFLRRSLAWKLTHKASQTLDQPLTHRKTSETRYAMWKSYTPKEFQGRMVLFRVEKAMDGGSEYDDDATLGWQKYAKEGIEVQFVAGGHGTVMEMPNVLDLADKLVPFLAGHEPTVGE